MPRNLATVDFWSSPDKYKVMPWLKGKTSKQNKHHYSTNIPIIKQTELSKLSKNKFTIVCLTAMILLHHTGFSHLYLLWADEKASMAQEQI